MYDIRNILNEIYPLSDISIKKIENLSESVHLKKGSVIMEAGKKISHLYFIKKGIVRAFSIVDGSEITFWFGSEGDAVLSMRSYVDDLPSYENIELLEDCELYKIETKELKSLFQGDIEIANWGRRYAEKELMKTEEVFISRQFKTAMERYQILLREHPKLLQRVSLGKIASFLGISQVSLSRIRAEIK